MQSLMKQRAEQSDIAEAAELEWMQALEAYEAAI